MSNIAQELDQQTTTGAGQKPVLPGDPGYSKLPVPPPDSSGAVPEALRDAWTRHMVNGFKQNEEMFKNTLRAFTKPYYVTIWMYVIVFIVGVSLFLLAGVIGLRGGNSVVTIVFGGLGAAAFLAFFIRQPVQALEENLEFITWLGVAFNTYWTRLMYMQDPKTVQEELKGAEGDFRTSIEALIAKHAELRGQRPGK